MKQYITVEQLNELDKDKKDKLMGIIDDIEYVNVRKQNHYVAMVFWHEDKNYLLSIGQMIEFLGEHDLLRDHSNPLYGVDKFQSVEWMDGEELADSLWEAVKEVLTKQE